MRKERNFFYFIIPCLCIIAVVFIFLAYINDKNGKTLEQQKNNLSSQIEATTEKVDKKSPASDKSSRLKSQINNLEEDIENINDYAQEKGLLEKVAKRLIDLLTFEFPTEEDTAQIKSNISKIMTEDCYTKFIESESIYEELSTSYEQGFISYSDIDTDSPKVFVRTTYESNEENPSLKYFDLSFQKQNNNEYLISDVKITQGTT